MKIIKDSDFKKELKSPAAGYLFFGEEDYMKQHSLRMAREAICPDESLAVFNEMKLSALNYSPETLLDMIASMPMMADRKLITLTGLDLGAMKQSELDSLCAVLSQLDEYDYNTVIIVADSDRFDPGILPKRPSQTLTRLAEYLTPVSFEKNSPARLSAWVGKHYEHNGVLATPEICSLTVERCGRDMYNLASETDKISYYVLSQGRREVTRKDVVNVSVSASEYDAFAFTNAITSGRKDKALEILSDMKFRRTDPIIIMSEVTKTVCDMISVSSLLSEGLTLSEISATLKLHEYKVGLLAKSDTVKDKQRLLEKCKAADLDLKSYTDGYSALEKLICTM